MKIEYIKISNILSFKHYADINDAPAITFDDGLNILIGQNGSGKSTALEVINFIFKKVIFVPYNVNQDEYARVREINADQRKQILRRYDEGNNYGGFRLAPNWNTENAEQKIQLKIRLDDIDKNNLIILEKNKGFLSQVAGAYSSIQSLDFSYIQDTFIFDIKLNNNTNVFSYVVNHRDGGLQYLIQYNYYKELIDFYNRESSTPLEPLQESFTLIGGYRNYNAFSQSVSLSEMPAKQIQNIKNNEINKSTNTADQAEPPIFNLVRLRIAANHMSLVFTNLDERAVEVEANKAEFLESINKKLAMVNLKVEIKLQDRHTWAYSFRFLDINTNRQLEDINSLSAGQKSIVHLIFESYGRGNLKGGLVIIDEPEIHLHYQFQYEYLRIIEQLNKEQSCQYILVTHSEALISSETIDKVKRFSLDANKNTIIRSPKIQPDQKTLIRILDNTRSTYAFFAKKVVLVEGDTDRYFFQAIFRALKPELNQEIAILDIGGKGNFENWRDFFTAYGLEVHFIGDFDNVFTLKRDETTIVNNSEKSKTEELIRQEKLDGLSDDNKTVIAGHYNNLIADKDFLVKPQSKLWKPLFDCYRRFASFSYDEMVPKIRTSVTNIDTKIEALYAEKIYILKQGKLEVYLGSSNKKIDTVIAFCQNINTWLATPSVLSDEIKVLVNKISE